ncbi:hypothetical protein Clacol_004624 [Clathrus columnatus]|uniref:Major facilitator superfamily (MFS) profile domain-containing protein n=1 Tax=Clathrus columnatus TaxID=1419009 RepID=A0AAV5AA98_9AGAM|nr:hypothetical protein Clacol_004624 [Clathrus columnatus]
MTSESTLHSFSHPDNQNQQQHENHDELDNVTEEGNQKHKKSLMNVKGVPIGFVSVELAIIASMGGFIFGYDTGQISDIVVMNHFLTSFATCGTPGVASTCVFKTSIEVGLLSIGTLFGALLGAPIADTFGRRRAMTIECVVFAIGIIIQLCSITAWYQFAIGRLIAGLGVGGLSAVVPLYQAETAPPQIRGTLTGTYQPYAISIGTRDLADGISWRLVVGISLIWAAILFIGISTMPESPRWLASKEKWDRCARSIARLSGISKTEALHHPSVRRELKEIKQSIEADKLLRKATWFECFRGDNKLRYRTLLGMSLQSFQQLTGANYFFYYGATVFKGVGISDSFVSQLILGGVNFGCTFLGLYVMERFGRRKPLIIGGIWQSLWLFVFAAAGTAKDPMQNKNIGTLMIVSACLFILGYASTWAPGVWIIVGETFPTRSRAKQAALATSANWLWIKVVHNFLLAFFTPFITRNIQFRYGFVFAACNLAGSIVVALFLYESSGLSLEEVDMMYNDKNTYAWNSGSWKDRNWDLLNNGGNGNGNGNGGDSVWGNGNGNGNGSENENASGNVEKRGLLKAISGRR